MINENDKNEDNHSMATIFQLMARSGRVGQSWTAYAHIGNLIKQKVYYEIQILVLKTAPKYYSLANQQ